MDIRNSTFQYLGYYGPDSFGVTYTTKVCGHTDLSGCNQLDGTGYEINSVFQDDLLLGTFLWGAQDMTVTGNQYFNNIMYGFDSHDVTRNIVIEYNHSSYNGDHGIICSQACDHLTIEYNLSDHNGLVPWGGPVLDAEETAQVHGIMLHRGVTNSVVEFNTIEDQPNGAGIAIFDSDGDTIANNTYRRHRRYPTLRGGVLRHGLGQRGDRYAELRSGYRGVVPLRIPHVQRDPAAGVQPDDQPHG